MKRIILCIIFVFCSYVCSFNLYAGERANPVFDDRSWSLGWSQNKGEAIFEEYVLKGEFVENWTELVTMQFYPGLQKNTNPDIFEGAQKRNLSLVCPSIKWESIYQSEDERIWKWNIESCEGQPDQSEIARLKKTEEGFHLWHYAIKKSPIPPEKEHVWLEKLKAIQVVKSEEK